jgi:hypothetical protein
VPLPAPSKIELAQVIQEYAIVATEKQVQIVLTSLSDFQGCRHCGTRFRFGDLDCPHCGAELDDLLREWAQALLERLGLG